MLELLFTLTTIMAFNVEDKILH